MYENNKYTKWYYKIINNVKLKNRIKDVSCYYENHHIIPKSLGGTNLKENMILLTTKEHFICHLLLTKMVLLPEHKCKMNAAMSYFTNNTKRRLPSRFIEKARKFNSITHKNKIPWNKGIPWSDDIKKKIGIANSRCTLTPEGRERKKQFTTMNNPMKNEEYRKKISEKKSLTYEMTDPNGNTFIIKNLNKWCKENNFHRGNFSSVIKGKLKHYKKWTCKIITT